MGGKKVKTKFIETTIYVTFPRNEKNKKNRTQSKREIVKKEGIHSVDSKADVTLT